MFNLQEFAWEAVAPRAGAGGPPGTSDDVTSPVPNAGAGKEDSHVPSDDD